MKPIALAAYENFGQDYARVIADNAFNAHYERPSTIALLPDVRGMRVLDAGCGPGAYVEWFLKNGAQVTGVDVSPAMLEVARRNFGKKCEFHLHDLAEPLFQFADGSFDLILSSLTIHYISDLQKLFSEFRRVLKTKGQVVFSTHHPMLDFGDSPSQNYFDTELLTQDWTTVERPVTVQFYRRPLSQITEALTQAKFHIEKLSEGVLTPELKERYPLVYEHLSRKPQFLFLSLRAY